MRRCPRLVLSGEPLQVAAPAKISVALVTARDPDLAAVHAVAHAAIGAPASLHA